LTEDQIRVMGLSDKRERALIAFSWSGMDFDMDRFWSLVSLQQWGLASQELLNCLATEKDAEFYADAIWEG